MSLGALVSLAPLLSHMQIREASSPFAEVLAGPEIKIAAGERHNIAGLPAEGGATSNAFRAPVLELDPFPAKPEQRSETTETGAIGPASSNELRSPLPETGTWWVVLGSVPEAAGGAKAAERAAEAARRCEVGFASGRSSDYEGLTPGLLVFLSGPHADRAGAQRALRRITPCIGDAYVKWAKPRSATDASMVR
jgi:hypothetical protein